MKTISVTEMSTKGVSGALRSAAHEPVLVSRDGEPYVLMLDAASVLGLAGSRGTTTDLAARLLMAAHLFDQGALSMGRAARMGGVPLTDFIDVCDRLHIPVLGDGEPGIAREVDTFDAWLNRVG